MFAQENIYFTDCVLRHMHEHRFLAHLDPDEVPILPKHDNFTHLLDSLIEGYVSQVTRNISTKTISLSLSCFIFQ